MNDSVVYLPTRNAAYRKIGDEVVIVDTVNNRLMTLNGTGSVVWMMLDGRSIQEIADALVQSFSVERAQATEDVSAFLSEMESRGLVALRPTPEP
jgi:hypothetical protein